MRIITGATGAAHVTSNDDGEFNQGIWGTGLVVLPNGNKLSATITDNNTITIKDGDLVFQGRHALINPGSTESVTIATGTVDMQRNDLIVARYTLDSARGVESITLEVIEGTESSTSASDPQYTEGDIRTGSILAEVPLYRVKISGINIVALEPMFTPETDLYTKTNESSGTLLTKVLVAGETTITFTSSKIKSNNLIDPYTSVYGVNPVDMKASNGSVTLEFDEQEENITVGVVIRNGTL